MEQIGVKKAFEQINKSSIYLYLFDIEKLSVNEVKTDLAELNQDVPRLVIANKTDLVDDAKLLEFNNSDIELLFISAKEKNSLNLLKEALYNAVNDNLISNHDVVVTNARHYEALTKANDSLTQTLSGLNNNVSGDFLAMDIRQALHYLGEITGQITTDDLLGNIFSKFCIGK